MSSCSDDLEWVFDEIMCEYLSMHMDIGMYAYDGGLKFVDMHIIF